MEDTPERIAAVVDLLIEPVEVFEGARAVFACLRLAYLRLSKECLDLPLDLLQCVLSFLKRTIRETVEVHYCSNNTDPLRRRTTVFYFKHTVHHNTRIGVFSHGEGEEAAIQAAGCHVVDAREAVQIARLHSRAAVKRYFQQYDALLCDKRRFSARRLPLKALRECKRAPGIVDIENLERCVAQLRKKVVLKNPRCGSFPVGVTGQARGELEANLRDAMRLVREVAAEGFDVETVLVKSTRGRPLVLYESLAHVVLDEVFSPSATKLKRARRQANAEEWATLKSEFQSAAAADDVARLRAVLRVLHGFSTAKFVPFRASFFEDCPTPAAGSLASVARCVALPSWAPPAQADDHPLFAAMRNASMRALRFLMANLACDLTVFGPPCLVEGLWAAACAAKEGVARRGAGEEDPALAPGFLAACGCLSPSGAPPRHPRHRPWGPKLVCGVEGPAKSREAACLLLAGCPAVETAEAFAPAVVACSRLGCLRLVKAVLTGGRRVFPEAAYSAFAEQLGRMLSETPCMGSEGFTRDLLHLAFAAGLPPTFDLSHAPSSQAIASRYRSFSLPMTYTVLRYLGRQRVSRLDGRSIVAEYLGVQPPVGRWAWQRGLRAWEQWVEASRRAADEESFSGGSEYEREVEHESMVQHLLWAKTDARQARRACKRSGFGVRPRVHRKAYNGNDAQARAPAGHPAPVSFASAAPPVSSALSFADVARRKAT
ncbi:hypothetical protein DIPPA_22362 [Diplonema papillatum]|nr:hypothetical protein DIPPA_22362 [Diplonema papillatum]